MTLFRWLPLSRNLWALLGVYAVCQGVLFLYGIHRLLVLARYRKYKRRGSTDVAPIAHWKDSELPRVTIQVPCYNEMYVIERLITALAAIDYPRDRFEIQVLDDSTDETTAIVERQIDLWRGRGLNITMLRREERIGFKAGALAAGLRYATGELVAVFDADFVPTPSFLRETVDYFTDPAVGAVQSRWTHLNRDYSLLTQYQSIVLDAHHQLEQTSRCYAGCFFSFNGTAGIWRRHAIDEAGGWEHDTLAEDTDLSYRAQLKGWKLVYLAGVTSPAELPVDIHGYLAQQRRWIVGTLQCARKHLGSVWRAPNVPMRVKVEATYQLTANVTFVFSFLLACLSGPLLMLRFPLRGMASALIDAPLLFVTFISVMRYYFEAQRDLFPSDWQRRLVYLPWVPAIMVGIARTNALSAFAGLFGRSREFIRTPKYGMTENGGDAWHRKRYASRKQVPIFEVGLGIYFVGCCFLAVYWRRVFAVPFNALFAIGSFYVAWLMTRGVSRPSSKHAELRDEQVAPKVLVAD